MSRGYFVKKCGRSSGAVRAVRDPRENAELGQAVAGYCKGPARRANRPLASRQLSQITNPQKASERP